MDLESKDEILKPSSSPPSWGQQELNNVQGGTVKTVPQMSPSHNEQQDTHPTQCDSLHTLSTCQVQDSNQDTPSHQEQKGQQDLQYEDKTLPQVSPSTPVKDIDQPREPSEAVNKLHLSPVQSHVDCNSPHVEISSAQKQLETNIMQPQANFTIKNHKEENVRSSITFTSLWETPPLQPKKKHTQKSPYSCLWCLTIANVCFLMIACCYLPCFYFCGYKAAKNAKMAKTRWRSRRYADARKFGIYSVFWNIMTLIIGLLGLPINIGVVYIIFVIEINKNVRN